MARRNPAAVQLGRKGAKATAHNRTPEERTEHVRKAAQARWAKEKQVAKARSCEKGRKLSMHYLLFYEVGEDYVSKRAQFREAHLEKAWKASDRGELVLAGA